MDVTTHPCPYLGKSPFNNKQSQSTSIFLEVTIHFSYPSMHIACFVDGYGFFSWDLLRLNLYDTELLIWYADL